ncbi:MAG: hypothetical protein KAR35_10135 [Candidatus Heimdallarchaeota archaeon]|nr:hypothetical protein [Candidatus Heimdallarchaeota archaeon]MCK5049715.1 hypothetical protein [Candidatus Heimdallarchaeota archaeon]
MIGYPFFIAVGVFPILLLTMAFIGTESILEVFVFYRTITLFAFVFLLLLSVLRVAKKDFFRQRGVNSWKEYYSLYLSKNAKNLKIELHEKNDAKITSQSLFLDALQEKTTQTQANTDNVSVLAHLMAVSAAQSSTSGRSNIKIFISASLFTLSAIIIFTCSFLLIFNQPLSFLWAFLFFEGMMISFFSSSKSIGVPFNSSQKNQPHIVKRLLFGKRVKEVDFKVFLLYIGMILVILSLLLFAVQEITNH